MSEWIGGIECHKCCYLGEYDDKIDEFVRNIESQSFTQVANLALLCKTGGLDNFLKEGYPVGMKTFIKAVHKRTADRLAANANIEANYREKIFRLVHNTDCGLNVVGMNVIASSTELFEELKEGVNRIY